MSAPSDPRVRVTLVESPACHFCEDAAEALAELARTYRVELEVVDLTSAEGARLVGLHRPALNPLVLVEGEYFSAGRLPRKKLARLLASAGAELAGAGVA